MEIPLNITYKNIEKTDFLENLVREKAAKLEQVCGHLQSCRVAIEKEQEHQQNGQPFRVRIDMTVPPGHELAARREASQGDLHTALPAVIRETFDAARSQLKSLAERQRQDVKSHPNNLANGVVDKLFPEQDHGFIKSTDGRDIFFHRNSVLNHDFDRLVVGAGVRYVEEPGEQGPQASTVQLEDKLPNSTVV